MPIYEYICPQGHVTESWAKIDDRKKPVTCRCGEKAEFKISCPMVALDGTDPGFPDAYDKWAKRHEKAGKERDSENLTHF